MKNAGRRTDGKTFIVKRLGSIRRRRGDRGRCSLFPILKSPKDWKKGKLSLLRERQTPNRGMLG